MMSLRTHPASLAAASMVTVGLLDRLLSPRMVVSHRSGGFGPVLARLKHFGPTQLMLRNDHSFPIGDRTAVASLEASVTDRALREALTRAMRSPSWRNTP